MLVVVLLVTGVIGGGDDNSSASNTTTDASSGDLTIVPLEAVGDSGASGQAVFASVKDQPVLQINLTGLKPTDKDQTYIVWLYNSDDVAFPLARDKVGDDGNLTGAAPIPSQLIGLVGPDGFNQIDVSLASNAETAQALQAAAKSKKLPSHSGTSVLRGEIPTGAADSAGATGTTSTPTGLRRPSSGGQQLAGVHHPGGVEALLQRPAGPRAQLADLGAHVGRVVLADGVVMGDRAAGGDDRLTGRGLRLSPLLELLPARCRARKVK